MSQYTPHVIHDWYSLDTMETFLQKGNCTSFKIYMQALATSEGTGKNAKQFLTRRKIVIDLCDLAITLTDLPGCYGSARHCASTYVS